MNHHVYPEVSSSGLAVSHPRRWPLLSNSRAPERALVQRRSDQPRPLRRFFAHLCGDVPRTHNGGGRGTFGVNGRPSPAFFPRMVSMLVLSRQQEEQIIFDFTALSDRDIADLRSGKTKVSVKIVDIRGDKVRVGTEAPKSVIVHRKEIWDAIRREKREAAATSTTPTNP